MVLKHSVTRSLFLIKLASQGLLETDLAGKVFKRSSGGERKGSVEVVLRSAGGRPRDLHSTWERRHSLNCVCLLPAWLLWKLPTANLHVLFESCLLGFVCMCVSQKAAWTSFFEFFFLHHLKF